MTAPGGTFLAPVRNGAIRIPAPIREYCDAGNWTLFRFEVIDADHVKMHPVLHDDAAGDFNASLSPDGMMWIPADVRKSVSLGEQSVMLRIEGGVIHLYLRKVFDTLGFRPR